MIQINAIDHEGNLVYEEMAEDLLSAQIKTSEHFVGLYGGRFPIRHTQIDNTPGAESAFYLIEDDYQRVEVQMKTIECTVLPFRRL